MNIHFENVDINSHSGPNSFASKLVKYMKQRGHSFDPSLPADVDLCFIESFKAKHNNPMVLRLDGIYFNTMQDYNFQNRNIRLSYERADGVIIQSEFDKKLIFEYFGEHRNATVIRNGADTEFIKRIQPALNTRFDKIWSCASYWRPHKRLDENIKYFLEHSGKNDCLFVAGTIPPEHERFEDGRILYTGELDLEHLLKLYKTSDYFVHLAWLDHCPNVVVDAKAAGCKIICSSAGGTSEIAGNGDIIIQEEEWNFEPVELYNPPKLDFSKKIIKKENTDVCMKFVSEKYEKFLEETKR
tara:strand:+ start:705 stop:1601 length:897 start_codon:yes stop_codon:yes gene_type:complete